MCKRHTSISCFLRSRKWGPGSQPRLYKILRSERGGALTSMTHLVGHLSAKQGSLVGRGTWLGCGFDPQSGVRACTGGN